MKIGPKTVASRVFTRFLHDLTYWPSFDPTSPIFELDKILSRWSFWASLMKIGPKLWPLECSQGFSMIWPTDLVFDPIWPIYDLDQVWWRLDQNVASRVFTRSFNDLTYWPSFWPVMIHIRSWLSLIKIGPKLWPPEYSQGFSLIWPTDQNFDLAWPIFELDRNIVKMIILSKFDEAWTWTVVSKAFTRFFYDLTYWPCLWPNMMKIGPKLWPPRVFTRFFEDLTYWPSFWPDMIHIGSWSSSLKTGPKLWPLECSKCFSMMLPTDLVFDPIWPIYDLDQVWWRLDQNVDIRVFTRVFNDLTYWPSFWPGMIHIRSWLSLIKIGPKLWPPEYSQGFSLIWPTDPIFDLAWPIFELDRNIVKMIILSKFDEDWTWTVVSKAFTRFLYDLTYWPCLWPNMMKIGPKLWPPRVFTRFFEDLTYWPSFWPDMIHIGSWSSLLKIGPKLWPPRVFTSFF